MIEANTMTLTSAYYRRLTEDQLNQIHDATLEILEGTGVRFQDDEAIELFKKAGLDILDGNRVLIPSWRVEWALNCTPKQILLYDQTGSPAIRLSRRVSYFGNGSDLLHIVDHRTGQRRPPVYTDIEEFIRILDALPFYDFVMSGFIPSDIGPDKAERYQMLAMLRHTKKPIIYVTTSIQNTKHSVAMAEVVAGGADALRRRPFAANYINISHPLRHNPESVQKLLWLSEKGLPFVYRPSIVTRGLPSTDELLLGRRITDRWTRTQRQIAAQDQCDPSQNPGGHKQPPHVSARECLIPRIRRRHRDPARVGHEEAADGTHLFVFGVHNIETLSQLVRL